MSARPAASPSRPSTKFIALTVATVTAIVSNPAWSGSSTTVPMSPNGTYSRYQLTPMITRTPAAVSWPTNLVKASIPQRSSMIPTSTMTPPATTTAFMSSVYAKPLVRAGNSPARAIPASTPMYMPTPPRRGVGIAWTSRVRGTATAPVRVAMTRTTPVARYVMTAAASPTSISSRSGTPAPLLVRPDCAAISTPLLSGELE